MYSLIEYSSKYSETTESLKFYSKDEAIDFNADIDNKNNNNNNSNNNDSNNNINFKSPKRKAKLLGNTVAQPVPNQATGIPKNAAIAVLLQYWSNFWRSLDIPLINCKIELKLKFVFCLQMTMIM